MKRRDKKTGQFTQDQADSVDADEPLNRGNSTERVKNYRMRKKLGLKALKRKRGPNGKFIQSEEAIIKSVDKEVKQ